MITIIVLASLIVTSSIYILSNPLSIGLAILLIALIISAIFALSITSWLSFLIFLIYVGGILVLFSYFVAITPNQTLPAIYTSIILIASIIPIYLVTKKLSLAPPIFLLSNHKINILYINSTTWTLIILATLLLITIIIVVKITINFKGPLRPFK
jgi:NADH-ubiquinone oxidoreductase chain 6